MLKKKYIRTNFCLHSSTLMEKIEKITCMQNPRGISAYHTVMIRELHGSMTCTSLCLYSILFMRWINSIITFIYSFLSYVYIRKEYKEALIKLYNIIDKMIIYRELGTYYIEIGIQTVFLSMIILCIIIIH